MFKINRKDTRTVSSDIPPVYLFSLWMNVTPYSIDCFEGFEQVYQMGIHFVPNFLRKCTQ